MRVGFWICSAILLALAGGIAPAAASGGSDPMTITAAAMPVDWRAGGRTVVIADHFAVAHVLAGPRHAARKQARLRSPVRRGIDGIATGALPALKAGPAAGLAQPGLFGSVALSFRKLPAAARVRELEASSAAATGCADAGCRARTGLMRAFVAPATNRRDLIDRVNRAVNGLIAYRSDREAFGVIDHWAGPAETLARGHADCEDYALLKMALLAENGVEASAMSLVVLRDRSRDAYHAVLAVHHAGETLILDNLEKSVRRDVELTHYMPLFSVTEGKGFVHGWRTGGPVQMAALGSLGAIAPGEGISARRGAERGPR